jgi:hypothetical protein
MPAINLSLEHGRSLDEAKVVLRSATELTCARFGLLVRRTEWAPAGDAVVVTGIGFRVDMKVDAKQVHVTGDLPSLGGILNSPVVGGIKQIVTQAFRKRLGGK